MTARPTPDGESPSASSSFLSQLRPPRRDSLASLSSTSQVDKGNLAEALDQIHSTASQSDALTTFNEYTSPPSSSSGGEDKGNVSELKGGLSGLYSRFRTSVGNVKDIVTLSGEDSFVDDISTKSPRHALPTPTPTRVLFDLSKSANPLLNIATEARSLNGSRHSSRGPISEEASAQDSARKSRPSNVSSGVLLVGTKTASGSTGPLKSPANLTTAAASVASPAVVVINVNAIKESTLTNDATLNIPNQDTAAVKNPTSGSRAEARLSSAVGQQRPASLQSHSTAPHEDSLTIAVDPLVPISSQINPDDTPKRPSESGENGDAKAVRSRGSSTINTNLSYRSYMRSPEDTGIEKRDPVPGKSGNSGKETPRIIADPGSPQPPTTGGLVPSEVDRGFLSADRVNQSYQPLELPMPKPVELPPDSPALTSDKSLTRTSSETTATGLVHASRHKQPAGKSYKRDPMRNDVILPQARSKVLDREYWMRDENARDCFYCGDSFSTFRRKHHCSMFRSTSGLVNYVRLAETLPCRDLRSNFRCQMYNAPIRALFWPHRLRTCLQTL